MTSVLLIGVAPKYVDPGDPAVPAGTTPETIARGIDAALTEMQGRGWTAQHCSIAPDDTAEASIAACLAERPWDIVVIGGGVRVPPQNLELFERVVNIVRSRAPGAAIAFNTSPETTADAALRWLPDTAR